MIQGIQKCFKTLFALILLSLVMFSCIPIRKQLLLTDKSAKTYKKKQLQDTLVSLLPYEYKLRNGDVITINISSLTPGEYQLEKVANAGEVNAGYIINDSGYVDVPVIGMIKVMGLNTEQCRNRIKDSASVYLHNVSVSVKLVNFEVNIIGEISNPMTINSPDGKLSIIDAVTIARGPAQFTNLEKIKVIRQTENGDKLRIFYVNVSDIDVIKNREHFYLMPKDILVLEPLNAKRLGTFQRNLSFGLTLVSSFLLALTIYNTYLKN